MAIQGFCPSPPSPSHSPSPYYQLLERGSARLGRVKNWEVTHTAEKKKLLRCKCCIQNLCDKQSKQTDVAP